MTFVSLILRLLGLFVNSRISNLMGAEGMGLMQLGLSAEALAVTLAVSGIRFSVTRLAAEELAAGRREQVRRVVGDALRYALFFSCLAGMLLTFYLTFITAYLSLSALNMMLFLLLWLVPNLLVSRIVDKF